MREIRFFQPQATRKRQTKVLHRFDDAYGDLLATSASEILKKELITDSEMYLTKYSNKYKESHKHLYRLKQLLFGRWTIHKLEIPFYQLIIIVLTIQLSAQKIIRLNQMYLLSYKRSGFIIHLLTSFLVGMPLFAYFMFMGYYSKKCFIRYWQTTPILKGVAFSLIIILIFEISQDVITCSLAILYITTIIKNGIIWKTCQWENEIVGECLTRNQSLHNNIAKGICPKTLHDLPPYIFFVKYIRFNNTILLAIFISSLILFFGLMLFKKMKLFLCMINGFIIATILGPLLFATHFYFISLHLEYVPLGKNEPFTQLITCLRFMAELITQSLPSSFVTYTAKLNKSVKLTSFLDLILMYVASVLCDIVIQVWISINLHNFAELHHLGNCKFANIDELAGDKLLFVVILDVLTRDVNVNFRFVFVYLIIVAYWSIVGVLFCTYAIVETVLDEYFYLKKYKLSFYLGITSIIFGVAIIHCFRLIPLIKSISFLNLKFAVILLITIHLTLYSTTRFSKDYHFTFGHSINSNCLVIYKLIQILCTLAAITNTIIFIRDSVLIGTLENLIKDQWFLFIGIIPIILYGMWAIMTKHGKSSTIIMQEPEWGPPNPHMKWLRKEFGQNKDVLRQTFACNHNCLHNSAALEKEIKLWHIITENLEKKFEKLV